MPTDTAEMRETAQQTGTTTPEHHQTQAATGSPQSGAPSAADSIANMTGGASGAGLGSVSGSNLGTGTGVSAGTASASPASAASTASGSNSSAGSPAGMSRRGSSPMSPFSMLGNPFGMMRSMVEQMDRLFEDFTGTGLGRSRSMATPPALQGTGGGYGTTSLWYPQIEVSERGDNLVVCADLPGLKREDVQLEVHDDHLVLQGERRNESSQNQGGLYRTERSYGSFYRTIPLPDGVDPDQVRATFKDGVLEVTVPVPNRQQRLQGRRIEIT
jgi:HSP20 family protein